MSDLYNIFIHFLSLRLDFFILTKSSYIYDERLRKIKMALTKSEEFTKTENKISDWAKVLSHPARIKILKILAHKNVCMCGDIVDLMPLAQATVSQHLKELKRVGFIRGEIEGPKICYCIDYSTLVEAQKKINDLLNGIIIK